MLKMNVAIIMILRFTVVSSEALLMYLLIFAAAFL